MAIRDTILSEARARLGVPYRLDPPPDGTHTFDCSLYVLQVFAAAGIPMSGVRTAEQIRAACVPVAWKDVLPGDVLFAEHTYEPSEPSRVGDGHVASHVGISLGAGSGRMLNALAPVSTETNIRTAYWQEHLFEARRHPAISTTPTPSGTELWGIDVSSHQGAVDWARVRAAGAAFAFTKATGGAWYRNPTLAANWRGMKAAGLTRGAYHYAFETNGTRPSGSAEAEAAFFLATVWPLGLEPGDWLALDIEDGSGPLGDWALAWCRHVETMTGIEPLIYTSPGFSSQHGFSTTPALAGYPLWLAAYQATLPQPPAPWASVALWQHTDNATVPGVAGPVDRNVFVGTSSELAGLGLSKPVGLDAWRDRVGDGILRLMREDGTMPLMASTWMPFGRGAADAEAEECIAVSGARYLWHVPTGRHWVYVPA